MRGTSRPRAGPGRRLARVFGALGELSKAFSSESLPRTLVRGGHRFALGKRVKNEALVRSGGSVFLAKPGADRYQVRAFSAPLPNASCMVRRNSSVGRARHS